VLSLLGQALVFQWKSDPSFSLEVLCGVIFLEQKNCPTPDNHISAQVVIFFPDHMQFNEVC